MQQLTCLGFHVQIWVHVASWRRGPDLHQTFIWLTGSIQLQIAHLCYSSSAHLTLEVIENLVPFDFEDLICMFRSGSPKLRLMYSHSCLIISESKKDDHWFPQSQPRDCQNAAAQELDMGMVRDTHPDHDFYQLFSEPCDFGFGGVARLRTWTIGAHRERTTALHDPFELIEIFQMHVSIIKPPFEII